MQITYFILGLIMIPLGIFAIAAPEDFIHLQHCLTMRNVEPTDWYIGFTRFGGVVYILIGIALVIFTFIV